MGNYAAFLIALKNETDEERNNYRCRAICATVPTFIFIALYLARYNSVMVYQSQENFGFEADANAYDIACSGSTNVLELRTFLGLVSDSSSGLRELQPVEEEPFDFDVSYRIALENLGTLVSTQFGAMLSEEELNSTDGT